MTIDERLEKLVERTDAMTESLELIANMHLDNERRHAEYVARTEKRFLKFQERFAKTEGRMVQLMEKMNRLLHVVVQYELPPDDLEDPPF